MAGPQGWSGTQVALVVLALRLPMLASGVVAGRAVDRWGARRPMLSDLIARAFLLLLLAACGRAGPLPLLPVLVPGGLPGAASPATYAGIRTMIPRLVPDEQLGRANAIVALGDQLPLLGGAVLVGPAPALLGPSGALLVAVAMLLIAAVLAHALPRTRTSTVMRPAAQPRPAGQRGKWSPRALAVITRRRHLQPAVDPVRRRRSGSPAPGPAAGPVAPARHGAIFGLQRSLLASATPLGAAAGAVALEQVSPAAVLAVSAGGCALAGLLALTSRDLRRAQ